METAEVCFPFISVTTAVTAQRQNSRLRQSHDKHYSILPSLIPVSFLLFLAFVLLCLISLGPRLPSQQVVTILTDRTDKTSYPLRSRGLVVLGTSFSVTNLPVDVFYPWLPLSRRPPALPPDIDFLSPGCLSAFFPLPVPFSSPPPPSLPPPPPPPLYPAIYPTYLRDYPHPYS